MFFILWRTGEKRFWVYYLSIFCKTYCITLGIGLPFWKIVYFIVDLSLKVRNKNSPNPNPNPIPNPNTNPNPDLTLTLTIHYLSSCVRGGGFHSDISHVGFKKRDNWGNVVHRLPILVFFYEYPICTGMYMYINCFLVNTEDNPLSQYTRIILSQGIYQLLLSVIWYYSKIWIPFFKASIEITVWVSVRSDMRNMVESYIRWWRLITM